MFLPHITHHTRGSGDRKLGGSVAKDARATGPWVRVPPESPSCLLRRQGSPAPFSYLGPPHLHIHLGTLFSYQFSQKPSCPQHTHILSSQGRAIAPLVGSQAWPASGLWFPLTPCLPRLCWLCRCWAAQRVLGASVKALNSVLTSFPRKFWNRPTT